MPNKLQINSVTNANVYVNGGNLLGRAMEVTPPEVKLQMVEHKGLGMMASIEVPSGGMDKLETKFKFTSVYADVLKTIAGTRKVVSIQVRASIDSFVGGGLADEVALVMTLNGVFMSNTLGGFKQHEATQPEATLTTYYYKLEIDGEEICEVDVMNNIYKIAGEDVLARFRAIVGG